MLNRILLGAAGLVAGGLVATPAVLGLSGNSSFSRDIRVPVPSGAHQVQFAEPSDDSSDSPAPARHTEDRPGRDVLSTEPGDDHGGLRTTATQGPGRGGLDDGPLHDVGDDHGGDRGGHRGSDGGGSSGSGSGHRGHG